MAKNLNFKFNGLFYSLGGSGGYHKSFKTLEEYDKFKEDNIANKDIYVGYLDTGVNEYYCSIGDSSTASDHSINELVPGVYKYKPGTNSLPERLEPMNTKNEYIIDLLQESMRWHDDIEEFIRKFPIYDDMQIMKRRGLLISGVPGCHAKGTEILMFDGSTKLVEDIIVGDLLMGPDSSPRTVLELCRGRQEMVKINPVKGESFVINRDHILHLTPTHSDFKCRHPLNIKFSDFIQDTICFQRGMKLTRSSGIEFPKKDLKLDPYILGLWLGDGHSAEPTLTSMDPEIIDCWLRYGESLGLGVNIQTKKNTEIQNKAKVYQLTGAIRNGYCPKGENGFINALNDYGLLNNKHIPLEFLTSDREDRLQLLAGLIDTDGHLSIRTKDGIKHFGNFEIIQKNKELAYQIQSLARSLGFMANTKPSIKGCEYKGRWRPGLYYRITISGHLDQIPTKLPRKQAGQRFQIKDVLRTGFSYELLPEDDFYGFVLNKDHLYLTADYMIHHNSGKSTAIRHLANQIVGKHDAIVIYADYLPGDNICEALNAMPNLKTIILEEIVTAMEEDDISHASILKWLDGEITLNNTVTLLTTNYPERLPENILRCGRIDYFESINELPDVDRRKVLEFYLKQEITDSDVELTKGMVIADLKEVCIQIRIHDRTMEEAVAKVLGKNTKVKKNFKKKDGDVGLNKHRGSGLNKILKELGVDKE